MVPRLRRTRSEGIVLAGDSEFKAVVFPVGDVEPGADYRAFPIVLVDAEADDGANIYVTYRARMEATEGIRKALEGGGSTEFGDNYFISQIQFETGDERYGWLNNLMAVGEGKLKPNEVTYRVYAVVPD